MKHYSPLFATISILSLFMGFFGVSVPGEARAAAFSEEEVLRLSNQDRMTFGVPLLRMDDTLTLAARAKANDIVEKEYFAHTAPDGKTPWYFFDRAGYRYRYAGENLAIHFVDAESEQTAWMKSEKHRENILSSKYRDTGIAVVDMRWEGKETTVTVQLFGTRLGDVVADATPWKSLSGTIPTVSSGAEGTPVSSETEALFATPPSALNTEHDAVTIARSPSIASETPGVPYDVAVRLLYGGIWFLELMALGAVARISVTHSRMYRLRIATPM